MNSNNLLRLAVVAVLLVHAATIWSQDQTSSTEADRFGGYVFLDVDGNPLPFQSDEAIEEFLQTAEVETMAKIPVGVTSPKKAILSGDGVRAHAVFKYDDQKKRNKKETIGGKTRMYLTWRDWYGYDVAAYKVDRLLGLNRMPPIVERKFKRRGGAFEIWLEGTVTEHYRRENGHEPPNLAFWNQQQQIMRLFNNLVANRDPNQGNSLIDQNWRLWFIDCTRCFGSNADLLTPQGITHCDRGVWRALQELNEEDLQAQVSSILSGAEIEAILKRRDKLVAHIEELVAERGEEMVFFDLVEASDIAPWAAD